MGDDDQRLAPRRQVPGQPVDALDVEVVGRLVEDEQVVLAATRAAPARPGVRSPPDSGPTGRSSTASSARSQSPKRPASTSRIRGSAGPLVRRADGRPPATAPSPSASRSSAWPSAPTRSTAGVGHPAGVGRHRCGPSRPSRSRLAASVAPDDADAVALADPARDGVEQHGVPYALRTASRLTRCAGARRADRRHSAVPHEPRAPGTGPWQRFTARQVPAAEGRRRCRWRARGCGRGRPRWDRCRTPSRRAQPRPGRCRASGAGPAAASRPPLRGRCAARRPSAPASPGTRALHERRTPPGARAPRARHAAGRLRVDVGRRQSAVGERGHPMEAPAGQRRGEHLAAAGADRGSADERERHVAAEPAPPARAARRGRSRCPTARRRRAGRPAASALPPAMPPATGMPLVMCRCHVRARPDVAAPAPCAATRPQVGGSVRHAATARRCRR